MSASLSHLRAIVYAIAGYTAWVISDAFMKYAGEATLPPYETVAFLGGFVALVMLARAGVQKNVAALWPKNTRAQMGRAFLSIGCNLANALALKHLSLTLFYVTVFSVPMVIALLAVFALKEKLTPGKIIAIVVGFAGVVIAVDPFGGGSGDWIGYTAVLFSNCCYAVSTVWMRVISQSESTDSIVFFTGLVEALFCSLFLFIQAEPVSIKLLVILFAMALGSGVGNMLNVVALRNLAAATVAQFHYTQLVAGALIGYFVWSEVPAFHTVLGAAVIIASGLYVAARGNKELVAV